LTETINGVITNDFKNTLIAPSFQDITIFDASPNLFDIDNVMVTEIAAVPEVQTSFLFMAGLGLLGLFHVMRRRSLA
jgi:hypothetical protein